MFDLTGDAYGEIVIKSDIHSEQFIEIEFSAFKIIADDKDDKRYLLYLKDNSIDLNEVSKDLEILSEYISSGYINFNSLRDNEVWETNFVDNKWTPIVSKK